MSNRHPTDWEVLLRALRAERFPVGAVEYAWLQHAWGLRPELTRGGLRALLASVFVKDRERRGEFDVLFDDWYPERGTEAVVSRVPAPTSPVTDSSGAPAAAAGDGHMPGAGGEGGGAVGPSEPARTVADRIWAVARRRDVWGGLLALVLVLGMAARFWPEPKVVPKPDGPDVPQVQPGVRDQGLRTVSAVPPPRAEPFEPPNLWARGSGAGLALGALALGGLALRRYRRETRLPEPVEVRDGPAWYPPPALEPGAPELLSTDELRTVVWGIERFVSEEPTAEVDPERTVAATARAGGIPELRYRRAVYPREVWLWVDDAAEEPSIERLAAELKRILERAGLPVRRGAFFETPATVHWDEGQALDPRVVEGHRQGAIVALLTDGAGLARAQDSALTGHDTAALLQGLAQWPRLAFVDFGRGRLGLAARLGRYGVRCIAPSGLPGFLGEGRAGAAPARSPEPALVGALRQWAAAAALSPEPVDMDTAYALRRALGLRDRSLVFEDLLHNGEDLGGRVDWPRHTRARLLRWLAEAEAPDGARTVPGEGVLGRALGFWRGRLEAQGSRRSSGESRLHPWRATPAERRLRMEEALLDLWTEPEKAAEVLYAVYKGGLEKEIRARLAAYEPVDWAGDPDRIPVPWRWSEQHERVRWLFGEMGLGGEGALRPRGGLRPAATLAAGLGLCLGLGLAGAVLALRPPALDRWTDPESGITFLRIPGGSFLMGSPESDREAYGEERPQHRVTLDPFWMARTETTNAQYRRHPEHAGHEGEDDLPAVGVSWDEAKAYCEHFGFHLPTEAQWEYAARAGTTTRWSFGDDESELGDYAWYAETSDRQTHPVATKAPNPWGLHDIHGNVWEWVEDCYARDAYAMDDRPEHAPLVTGEQCTLRVVRGGSAWRVPRDLRSALRGVVDPEARGAVVGFRCVRVPGRQLEPLTD